MSKDKSQQKNVFIANKKVNRRDSLDIEKRVETSGSEFMFGSTSETITQHFARPKNPLGNDNSNTNDD